VKTSLFAVPLRSGVRHVVLSALLATSATLIRAEDWAPNITLTAAWMSNASNAEVSSDQIDSLQMTADGVASERYGVGRDDALHLTGHLAAEWWPRYDSLLQGAVGARGEWRHKFGLGALAPTFSAEIAGDYLEAQERERHGVIASATLAFQKRFSPAFRVTVAHQYTERYARSPVFDQESHESRLVLDRDFDGKKRLTLSVHFRDGDVVSYATPPRPDLVAIASDRIEVDTFNRPMVAYSIDARSYSARASYARAMDETSAVVATYEWRYTERRPLEYTNHLVSIALVHQF
jgi:hypothetical protein